jgi:hypothetical protein
LGNLGNITEMHKKLGKKVGKGNFNSWENGKFILINFVKLLNLLDLDQIDHFDKKFFYITN